MSLVKLTLVGGPTALVEAGRFRLLTDPTFDGPGEYRLPHTTLVETSRLALGPDDVGAVDAVLLSHDQHADNLDTLGTATLLKKAGRVFTTRAAAARLGGNVEAPNRWPRRHHAAGASVPHGMGTLDAGRLAQADLGDLIDLSAETSAVPAQRALAALGGAEPSAYGKSGDRWHRRGNWNTAGR